jgi:hypothetical protein
MSEAHGVKARIELARDILRIRESLTTNASIGLKHLAASRIEAIRGVLLGRKGAGLIDELLSPSMGAAKLQRMSNEIRGSGDWSSPDSFAALNYIGALQSGLSVLGAAERRAGAILADVPALISSISPSKEVSGAIIDANIERGRIPKEVRDKLPELKAMADQALSINHDALLKEHAPEAYAAKMALDNKTRQALTRLEEAENALQKIKKLIGRGEGGEGNPGAKALEEELAAAKDNYEEAYKAYRAHWDGEMRSEAAKAREAVKAAQAKLHAPLIDAGKAFAKSVIEASVVTVEQAQAWADTQDITPPGQGATQKDRLRPQAAAPRYG